MEIASMNKRQEVVSNKEEKEEETVSVKHHKYMIQNEHQRAEQNIYFAPRAWAEFGLETIVNKFRLLKCLCKEKNEDLPKSQPLNFNVDKTYAFIAVYY